MLRKALIKKKTASGRAFKWRSHEISRIEGLCDAVFAFAVTLLVVSLEVPRTFAELSETLHGFVPFAACFAMLFQIWYGQFLWFRRYGLQDAATVALNGVLLFVVLFYVYPLKFLFTYLVNIWTGGHGMARLPSGRMEPMLGPLDGYWMMIVYDAGFIAVFGVFILLYLHAWRSREDLELSGDERFEIAMRIGGNLCMAGVGTLSLVIVLIGGAGYAGWAGTIYFLIGPLLTLYYTFMGRVKRKRERMTAALAKASSELEVPPPA
jgi:hypothetical protein